MVGGGLSEPPALGADASAALSASSDGGEGQATLASFPVELENPNDASGLADMLHQFLQQTVESSPTKLRAARKLSGTLWFQSAEDMELVVALTFARDRIGVADAPPAELARPSLTADFLSTAHITTGEESPFALLLQKKISARVRLTQALFLLRVLRFMKIDDADASGSPFGSSFGSSSGQTDESQPGRSRSILWLILVLIVVVTVAWLWFARW